MQLSKQWQKHFLSTVFIFFSGIFLSCKDINAFSQYWEQSKPFRATASLFHRRKASSSSTSVSTAALLRCTMASAPPDPFSAQEQEDSTQPSKWLDHIRNIPEVMALFQRPLLKITLLYTRCCTTANQEVRTLSIHLTLVIQPVIIHILCIIYKYNPRRDN